jgi:hypothetical protein
MSCPPKDGDLVRHYVVLCARCRWRAREAALENFVNHSSIGESGGLPCVCKIGRGLLGWAEGSLNA